MPKAKPKKPAPAAGRGKSVMLYLSPEALVELDHLCSIEAERTGVRPDRLRSPVVRRLIRAAYRAAYRAAPAAAQTAHRPGPAIAGR